jgi:hypothetical protein
LECLVTNLSIRPGTYNMHFHLCTSYEVLDSIEDPFDFEIPDYIFYPGGVMPEGGQGYLMADHHWSAKSLQP